MKCSKIIVAGGLLLAAQGGAAEAALDMSKPLVCAATRVGECISEGECAWATPETFNLPVLLRIDIANKVAESARAGGEKRVSAITSATDSDGVSVLQGVDATAAWSTTIVHASGQMTVVSARPGLSYTVFGTCATL